MDLGRDWGVRRSDRAAAAWMSGIIVVTLTVWSVFKSEAGKYIIYTLPLTLSAAYLYFNDGVVRWYRPAVISLGLYLACALTAMLVNSWYDFLAVRDVAIIGGYLFLFTLWFRAPASTADFCLFVLAVGMVIEAVVDGVGESVDLFGSNGILESTLAFPIGVVMLYYLHSGQRGRAVLAGILLFLAFKRITFVGVVLAAGLDFVLFNRYMPRALARVSAVCLVLTLSMAAVFSSEIFAFVATWLDLPATTANGISLGRHDIATRLWGGLNTRSFVGWLFGAGPGAADAVVIASDAGLQNPHNDWLKVLYDYGIIGFIVVHMVLYRTLTEHRLGLMLYVYGATLMMTDNIFIYMFYHPFVMLMLSAARRAPGEAMQPARSTVPAVAAPGAL